TVSGTTAALASGLRKSLACVRGLIVAPPTHFGSAQQVGSLHSPPGCENPSPAFVGSLLHRPLTSARRNKSARCTRLRVANIPRLRSWAHCCCSLLPGFCDCVSPSVLLSSPLSSAGFFFGSSMMWNSTRRLASRPALVLLLAMGTAEPKPAAMS